MKMKHLYPCSVILALTSTLSCARQITFLDNFDKLPAVPAEGLLTPVGTYNNLTFENFFVNQPGIPGILVINGVGPHSSPNQCLGGTSDTQISTLTVPADKSIKTFELNSWYYGCAANSFQGGASLAKACKITVTGYTSSRPDAQPAVKQTFEYKPPNLITVQGQPTLGTFQGFTGLVKATFVQSPGALQAVILCDDIAGSVITAK